VIAVDIGNSRIKLGRFDSLIGSPLPDPVQICDLPITDREGRFDATRLYTWCNENVSNGSTWYVASVNRSAAHWLIDEVNGLSVRPDREYSIRKITFQDVLLAIRVDEPARVGIDRLLAALAADRLRQPDHPAIIVDMGTAITVDLLEADGAFAGGAILPGVAMSARALSEQTDALPLVSIEGLQSRPPALGKSTTAAIQSGLCWGTIGAIRELVSQLSQGLSPPPELFLTGGCSQQMSESLSASIGRPVRYVPHLVLSGIALVET
jgi:type III pantothenate kinase